VARFRGVVFFLLSCLLAAYGTPGHEITEAQLATDTGVTIHYLQAGDVTSSRALILIPGWRLPAYLWTEQIKTFAATMRVIAIDPRSQGQSTKTTEGNSPEQRARDLHDLLGKLRIAQPVLVGWSQGAQDVAAYVAQFGSDAVAAVVFVDSPVSIGPDEIEKHSAFSKIILGNADTYAAHPVEFSRGMILSLFKRPHPELDTNKLLRLTLQTPTDIGVAMLMMDIFGANRLSPLGKLSKPALVIASAESPLRDLQKQMATIIPGGQFVELKGVGHAVFVDDPAHFDAALSTFLQRVTFR
jgi:non-heme chloroperoxidase